MRLVRRNGVLFAEDYDGHSIEDALEAAQMVRDAAETEQVFILVHDGPKARRLIKVYERLMKAKTIGTLMVVE